MLTDYVNMEHMKNANIDAICTSREKFSQQEKRLHIFFSKKESISLKPEFGLQIQFSRSFVSKTNSA